jgi:hypothetical protein
MAKVRLENCYLNSWFKLLCFEHLSDENAWNYESPKLAFPVISSSHAMNQLNHK